MNLLENCYNPLEQNTGIIEPYIIKNEDILS